MKQPIRLPLLNKTATSPVRAAPAAPADGAAAPERLRLGNCVRILLVDDHPFMRQGLKALIAQQALRDLRGGEVSLSERVKGRMLHGFVEHRTDALISPMEEFSDRKMEVFELLGNGYGTREIANLLNLSVKTID